MFVKADLVSKTYGSTRALDSLCLELAEGGMYAITGASGSGKSTLLYLLAGLEQADSGTVEVGGRSLSDCDDRALADYRNGEVGLVFQFHFLLSSMSCLDNILLPAKIGGRPVAPLLDHVHSLAHRLGVEKYLAKRPHQLSGGEQQRVNIIRALCLKPRLLLCDEPTGNLDSENSHIVVHLLRELAELEASTLVVVTHDESIARDFSRRFLMCDGKVVDESRA